MAIDSVRTSLAPDIDAPAAARWALDGFRGQLEDDVIERSAFVVTEVVTNNVTHAGLTAAQPIDLNIRVSTSCLHMWCEFDLDPHYVRREVAEGSLAIRQMRARSALRIRPVNRGRSRR